MTQQEIDTLLRSYADEKYKEFNGKIVASKLPMWGVRAPQLQKLAKQIAREPSDFLDTYRAENYEQVLLYALVLSYAKLPIEKRCDYLDGILPLFDNWAHVDMTLGACKALGKDRDYVLRRYGAFVNGSEFERRFLVVFLMNYCLTEDRLPTVFALYTQMQCDMYYVNMGIAWGLSVALVKFYEQTVAFLRQNVLSEFVLHKTVQKARESFRVSPERKAELRALEQALKGA